MSDKDKQRKIAVYSEKGGVGKTTILSSIASKICTLENSVFLDADASSQSLSDILKFYGLNPKIVYRDNICVLPFLLEIHRTTPYFFIDLAGREATISEIDYLKYIDIILIPIPPIYSNYSTPIHTVDKLIKNGVDSSRILITINYMWSNDHLDSKTIDKFVECIEVMTSQYRVNCFIQGISFSGNLNRNNNCLNVNSKYIQDIMHLSEFIKSIIFKT